MINDVDSGATRATCLSVDFMALQFQMNLEFSAADFHRAILSRRHRNASRIVAQHRRKCLPLPSDRKTSAPPLARQQSTACRA
jgi:hypothetical protein